MTPEQALETLREAVARWNEGYSIQIADMRLVGRARDAVSVLASELERLREDRDARMAGQFRLQDERDLATQARDAAVAERDALLDDVLVLMDHHASDEVQMEARRRIIGRHGRNA